MSRSLFICGNWKMNKTRTETSHFLKNLLEYRSQLNQTSVDISLAVPFTSLEIALQLCKGSRVKIASQNVHAKPSGAFTGEISAAMLLDLGVGQTLVGHSERRQFYGESDDSVAAKTKQCIESKLLPIVCVGETLAEREADETFAVLTRQMSQINPLCQLSSEIVIAYEPVWAIGTGRTATESQAQEAHAFIRTEIRKNAGLEAAARTRILYGGSVNPQNSQLLLSQPDVDGALVGGASLKTEDFIAIIDAALANSRK